jgi:putative endonuclease
MDKSNWIESLKIGDTVCDCRFKHLKIKNIINGTNDKTIILEDDSSFSAKNCCDEVDHPKHWFVYILSCADKTLYTGITNDLDRRIKQHNNGVGAKYTKGRTPVKLLKSFVVADKSSALKLEYKIKQMSRNDKLKYNGE